MRAYCGAGVCYGLHYAHAKKGAKHVFLSPPPDSHQDLAKRANKALALSQYPSVLSPLPLYSSQGEAIDRLLTASAKQAKDFHDITKVVTVNGDSDEYGMVGHM